MRRRMNLAVGVVVLASAGLVLAATTLPMGTQAQSGVSNSGQAVQPVHTGNVLTVDGPRATLTEEEIARIVAEANAVGAVVPAGSQPSNTGDSRPVDFTGHKLTSNPRLQWSDEEITDIINAARAAEVNVPAGLQMTNFDGEQPIEFSGHRLTGGNALPVLSDAEIARIVNEARAEAPGVPVGEQASNMGTRETVTFTGHVLTSPVAPWVNMTAEEIAAIRSEAMRVTVASTDALRETNEGEMRPFVFAGHDLTVGTRGTPGGGAILYAPSEADDPTFRAAVSAAAGGATVDYYDARAGTPDARLLSTYDCVFTWANFAYDDAVLFGDRLADFVDAGGKVMLGQWCLPTQTNWLEGRIMAAGYNPATAPDDDRTGPYVYAGDGTTCVHNRIRDYQTDFRDQISPVGGAGTDGTYTDGALSVAYRSDFRVFYSAGNTGYQYGSGDWARLVADMCACGFTPPGRILYAPTQPDNAAFRAAVSAAAGGATVDYYDARAGTPSPALLSTYDCVMTWVNFAYANNVLFGDRLADYVDAGGKVILGQWCIETTQLNWLEGRIMTAGYNPATASSYSSGSFDYAGSGQTCIHNGVAFYQTQYRDEIAPRPGAGSDGTYIDGWPSHAYRQDFRVIYSAGNTGLDYGTGDWPLVLANACECSCCYRTRVLYAPSQPDNAEFRAQISAALGGATVDYYDARAATPSVAVLSTYDCVFTWVNYSYNDEVLFGNRLADYVDLGGRVILGQWCIETTQTNWLEGRIMTAPYNPATATDYTLGATYGYAGDGSTCIHNGVNYYDTQYRDEITPAAGAGADGTYVDGWTSHAYRADKRVFYSAGNTGLDYGNGDWGKLIANMCKCPVECRILYAPTQADNPAFRAQVAMHAGGATVDYYDARVGTPSATLLSTYDCVFTWPDFAYADKVLFGDRLANFVDRGGKVILGQWCLPTQTNWLEGRIMNPGYNPATATDDDRTGPYYYAGDGDTCIHRDVTNYDTQYKDRITVVPGNFADGSYTDGTISHCYRGDWRVFYSAGNTGLTYGNGEWAKLVANMCKCTAPNRILYAPTNGDDAAFRADLANVCGAVVDYFDAAADTPTVGLLSQYDLVFTWPDFAYANKVAFGNRLADYVDFGGTVVLGQWCLPTQANWLEGRIMNPGYNPATAPDDDRSGPYFYAGDGISCLHNGVNNYQTSYRDQISAAAGGTLDGTYGAGRWSLAYRADYRVVYSAGNTGYTYSSGDYPRIICNALSCSRGCSLNAVFSVGRHDSAGAYPGGLIALPVSLEDGLVEPREQSGGELWLRCVFDSPVDVGELFVNITPDPGVLYGLQAGVEGNEVRIRFANDVPTGRYTVTLAGACCATFPICYAQGDVNCSGNATGLDLGAIQSPVNWNQDLTVANPRTDINRDGQATGLDLGKVQSPTSWNQPYPPLTCGCP